jgi:hypothetical protein
MDETVLSSENFGENGAGEDLENDESKLAETDQYFYYIK